MREFKVSAGRLALAALMAAGLVDAKAENLPPHAYRQQCQPCPSPCPQNYYHGGGGAPTPATKIGPDGRPVAPEGETAQDDQTQTAPTAPVAAPAPAPRTVASAPQSAAPQMIGDHFNNGYQFFSSSGAISIAGGARRSKVAENTSPVPQDRVFFNFNHYENAVSTSDLGNPQINVQKYLLGVEKTFADGLASVEIRAPLIDGLNADQNTVTNANDDAEFGNMVITPKVLLAENGSTRVSVGMGIQVPTADDATLSAGLLPVGIVENNSVHLQPFLGLMCTPSCNTFVIAYAQVDIDVTGYTAIDPVGLIAGDFEDPAFLYLDIMIGHWLYQSCACSGITGVAAIAEVHYSHTLEDFDTLPGLITPTTPTADIVNATAGVKLRIGRNSFLTAAGVLPLTDDFDRMFDFEAVAQLTHGF